MPKIDVSGWTSEALPRGLIGRTTVAPDLHRQINPSTCCIEDCKLFGRPIHGRKHERLPFQTSIESGNLVKDLSDSRRNVSRTKKQIGWSDSGKVLPSWCANRGDTQYHRERQTWYRGGVPENIQVCWLDNAIYTLKTIESRWKVKREMNYSLLRLLMKVGHLEHEVVSTGKCKESIIITQFPPGSTASGIICCCMRVWAWSLKNDLNRQ